MIRARRAAIRTVALGALAFLLSGCLKLTMDLEVAAEDTVSGAVVFGIDRDILDLTGQNLDGVLGEESLVPPDVEGVSVAPYEDDEFAGQEITLDEVRLEEFNQDTGGGGADSLTIARDGDTFVVDGALDLSTEDAATEGIPFDPSQFFESADIRITMTFPGDVQSSNGEIDGNTATWTPKVGERTEIRAVASAVGGGGSSPLLWIVLGVIVVAAIVVAMLVSRRRAAPSALPADGGFGSTSAGATVPVAPASTDPVPSQPEPPDPVPSQPEPAEPAPGQPSPEDPVPPQPGTPPPEHRPGGPPAFGS